MLVGMMDGWMKSGCPLSCPRDSRETWGSGLGKQSAISTLRTLAQPCPIE